MEPRPVHVPVLREAVLEAAAPVWTRRGPVLLVDGTAGAAGHARALLAVAPERARLLAVDRDLAAVERARRRLAPFGDRAQVEHAGYAELGPLIESEGGADLLLVDLGLSSDQLADAKRGFSFRREGPLDMRFDTAGELPTATACIAGLSEDELTTALRRGGEVPRARRVARAMIVARDAGELETTLQLTGAVEAAGLRPRAGKIHAATLVFQALRILVNDELGHLRRFLADSPAWLRENGRLLVIAFHSGEDRLVKQALRFWSRGPVVPPGVPLPPWPSVLRLVGKQPRRPSAMELAQNVRARSARLRVAERTSAAFPAELSPFAEEAR